MDSLIQYLKENDFDKQLEKLNTKFKNKKVVIYGAGLLFEAINSQYDLSKLNIIAISDGKFNKDDAEKEKFGYKKVILNEIEDLKPDYILVSILRYLSVIENFEDGIFKNSKIKIRPLVQKSLWATLKEIWVG